MRQSSISCVLAATAMVAVGWAGMGTSAQAQTRLLCVHDIEPPNGLNVHASANATSPVVARFPAKSCGIKITGDCSGNWCQVSFDNRTGWVEHKFMAYYDVPAGFKSNAIAQVIAPKLPPVAAKAPDPALKVEKEPQPTRPARDRQVATRIEKPASARAAKARQVASVQRMAGGDRVARREWYRSSPSYSYGFGSLLTSAFGWPTRMLIGGPALANAPATTGLASTSCVRRVEHGDVLYVRSGPGISNTAIDGIPPGSCGVARAGVCQGTWCRVSWRGRVGWVNRYYLSEL